MTDRPILFSAPMIRALLDGRKTQTRRVVTRARIFATPERPAWTLAGDDLERALQGTSRWRRLDGDGWFWEADAFPWQAPAARTVWLARIGYAPGDRLWVRETWRTDASWDGVAPRFIPPASPLHYAANERPDGFGQMRVSIHMPRWASRLTLYVTDVRVQRLQDVSEEDAIAEGITRRRDGGFAVIDHLRGLTGSAPDAGTAFRALWDVINGPDAWEANPWVAAYTFEVRRGIIDSLPAEIGEAA